MEERRRFRPHEQAERFEDVVGGLNKMTLARFEAIMAATGLRRRYFAANVSDNPGVRVMSLLRRVPPLREYLTASVRSIWERDPETGGGASADRADADARPAAR